jgi:hypothetical protein
MQYAAGQTDPPLRHEQDPRRGSARKALKLVEPDAKLTLFTKQLASAAPAAKPWSSR